jgi:formate dehydrogenase major subunit
MAWMEPTTSRAKPGRGRYLNPYFNYDPSKCIVCNRCVRACEETQGTFALTISGRGFESRITAGQGDGFMASDCVSCGACVQACPRPRCRKRPWSSWASEHSEITTCAYCGVGCGFKAEMKGEQVVRMVPWKDGKANEGHACVKGVLPGAMPRTRTASPSP